MSLQRSAQYKFASFLLALSLPALGCGPDSFTDEEELAFRTAGDPSPDSLTAHRQTTLPGGGVLSTLSEDGQLLYNAQGASIAVIDAAQLRQGEINGSPVDIDTATLSEFSIDASVTALLHSSDTLFIGGGDYGIYAMDDTTGAVTNIDTNLGDRWCFALAADAPRNLLFALVGGRDVTELRIYDLDTYNYRATVNVDTGSGLTREGTGYAMALSGDYAYLAMGAAGLARVKYVGGISVEQGPDFAPSGATTREQLVPYRARDVAIEGDWLYAAVDSLGVAELHLPTMSGWSTSLADVDLHAPVGTMPLSNCSGDPTKHYTIRVDAVFDSSRNAIVVAAGTAPSPSAHFEWGPYYSYSTFDWLLEKPGVDPSLFQQGCDTALFVFERPNLTTHSLAQKLEDGANGAAHTRSWKSLDMQIADNRFWVYDNEISAWDFERVAGQLTNLTQSTDEIYVRDDPSYSSVIQSLLDPQLLLAGTDGNDPHHMYRVEGSSSAPVLNPVAGTNTSDFKLGLLVNAQWLSATSGWEWVFANRSAVGTSVLSFTTSPSNPTALTQPGNFARWDFQYPPDPQVPGTSGRSYSSTAADKRATSDVVALNRSQLVTPIALYSRADIEAEASVTPSGGVLNPTPITHLAAHPELAPPFLGSETSEVHSFNMNYFTWSDGVTDHTVLGFAAGQVVESTHAYYEHPKLAFFDLSDCQSSTDPCTAGYDAASGGPLDPSKTALAYGSLPEAMFFDFDIAYIDGTQYAFAVDTSGTVVAFDLTNLFSGQPLTEVARWSMAPSTLDGFVSPMTDLEHRRENVPGVGLVDYLYVAANRRGIVKLMVDTSVPGTISMQEATTVNTIAQTSGILINRFNLQGTLTTLMVATDHEDGGLRLYSAD